jgi:hypothetical protein
MNKYFLRLYTIGLLILLLSCSVYAQNIDTKYSEDLQSIENIANAVVETISGEKGEKRDWDRFRNLFKPTAQLNAVFHRNDGTWFKVNTLDEFVDKAGTWYEDNGFREYQYKNTIDRFGHIAHVFQSYGSKLEDGNEIERGINSIQLVFDDGRWWIVNLIWDSETDKNKIPERYLK